MYNDKKLQKKFADANSEDDFDFRNTETGQKYTIKWSPSEDFKFISKHRFGPTKALSKSMPRRKRNLFQYKINRSLNFEIGIPANDNVLKSRNYNYNDSIYNERCLSRSAKILRSLNISFTPPNTGVKRINKSLNFDLSPSPKKIFSSGESLCHAESPTLDRKNNEIPKINKTLNFSSSSVESNLSSLLSLSADSIDENQNQTPSHRNRNVKKSLSYMSPSPRVNFTTSLKKLSCSENKLTTNFSYVTETPNIHTVKHSEKKSKIEDGVIASTPRNLLQDFEEDDKATRPYTPENVIQFVPESMSAIKKSHKKERQSHRLQMSHIYQSQEYGDQTGNLSDDSIVLSHSTERPATPILNNSYPSPNCSVNSIKQSHKKDKSKKRNVLNHSEDEISDSGSIFDYIEERKSTGCEILDDSEDSLSPVSNRSSDFRPISCDGSHKQTNVNSEAQFDNFVEDNSNHDHDHDHDYDYKTKATRKCEFDDPEADSSPLNNSHSSDCKSISREVSRGMNKNNTGVYFDDAPKQLAEHASCFDYSSTCATHSGSSNVEFEYTSSPKQMELESKLLSSPIRSKDLREGTSTFSEENRNSPNSPITHNVGKPNNTESDFIARVQVDSKGRPITPENVIDVMDQIRTDSIKKSHKKIKDKNKKILYRGQVAEQEPSSSLKIHFDDEIEIENEDIHPDNQASPDNVVRASTPDNINSSRMLLGQYSSVKKSHKKNKFKKTISKFTQRQKFFNTDDQGESSKIYRSIDAKQRKSESNESLTISSAAEKEGGSTMMDKPSIENHSVSSSSAGVSPLDRSTPNKRKKSFSVNDTSTSSLDVSHIESSAADYESADEEFKIFTPIKKRRSAITETNANVIPGNNLQSSCSKSMENLVDSNIMRCVTPLANYDTSFESFRTATEMPNTSKNPCPGKAITDLKKKPEPKNSDTNDGRSTPQNQSTSELIFDINSIKKSHKKDKRNFKLRRTVYEGAEKNDFQVINNINSHGEQSESLTCYEMSSASNPCFDPEIDSPKPSTSYTDEVDDHFKIRQDNGRNNVDTYKTPPNCLRVINYLHLRQADSIKHSHKKVRERKRQISITEDADLSDTGSIFDHKEKLDSIESQTPVSNTESKASSETRDRDDPVPRDYVAIEADQSTQPVRTPPNKSELTSKFESIKKSHKKVREYKRKGTRDSSADLSDDGSIFDSNERLDDMVDDSEKTKESSRVILPSE